MAINKFGLTATIVQQTRFPNFTFDATSSPTASTVETLIEQKAAWLNGFLNSAGFDASAIDSTGEPISYFILRDLLLDGITYEIERSFTTQDPERARALEERWNNGLNRIIRHPEILSDAFSKKVQRQAVPRSHRHSTRVRVEDKTIEFELKKPKFTMQWQY